MPNKHAAIKDLRKNKRHAVRNARVKTNVKALLKKARMLTKEGKKTEAATMTRAFQKAVDKAVKTGVFHKNFASRQKSSLMKLAK